MQPVIIALGSNIGNRLAHLRNAHHFLDEFSKQPLRTSSIYLTEPVGPSERYFLNAAIEITTDLTPENLLKALKSYEKMLDVHRNMLTGHLVPSIWILFLITTW